MKIPDMINSSVNLIDNHHSVKQEPPRGHMGCSIIGHHCERWLWLSFRWAVIEKFPGRILRLFRRGQLEEETIIDDLESIGCVIDDSQMRVEFGWHIGGSVDGIINNGLPESPNKRHVLEIKTHSLKSFSDLQKNGVEKSKPMHFVQMQLYMHGTGVDRAFYYAVCKDNDEVYTDRVRYDKDFADKYIYRAIKIVKNPELPQPITNDPTWYQCKFCAAHDFCHASKLTKEINCRTCAHSTPKENDTWYCERWQDSIPIEFQRVGCRAHVVHPQLTPWYLHGSQGQWSAIFDIDGEQVINGEDGIDSRELIK